MTEYIFEYNHDELITKEQIIRCRNCKYFSDRTDGAWRECTLNYFITRIDAFCSYAEAKDD